MAATLGAYGLRIEGLPGAAEWLAPVAPDAPVLRVTAEAGDPGGATGHVDGDGADVHLLALVDARMTVRRAPLTAGFVMTRRPPDADLLHPFLSPAAALAHLWAGRQALHAGAVLIGGGAVLLLGEKEAGKSSTLAWMAAEAGLPVLADDLAIIDGGAVLPGPRCIDLRPPTVEAFGARWGGRLVRSDSRLRLALGPAPLSARVRGVVTLGWGDEIALDPIPPAQRIVALAGQGWYPAAQRDGVAIMDLAMLPMFALRRPHSLDALPGAVSALREAFAEGWSAS
jgi:hypothetical protein